MKRLFLISSLLLASAATAVAQKDVQLPPYKEISLPNGATLLLMEKKDVPLISFNALVRGGAVADPAGKEGLAALTADLLRKGAGNRNAAQFAEAVDAAGGRIETSAGREAISIDAQFLSRDADLAIELLSDMLRRPAFAASEFGRTRDRAVESIRAAKDADLRALTPVYAAAFLFGQHPYGKPAAGTEASLQKISAADPEQFYRDHFGGNRLVLAVAGDFTVPRMESKLRRAFGDWPKAGAPLAKLDAPAPLRGRRVLLVDKPDATQTYFWIGNVGVRRGDPQIAAIDLANTVFGGRFTSLLNTALRIESGLSYGAASRLTRYSQPGAVGIFSYTKTESTGQAIDLALDVLSKYRSSGMSPEQLASAKAYVLGQFPPDLETAPQLAARIAEIELYGLDRNDVDRYGSAINAATVEDIRRTIGRLYPDPANLTFVLIGNAHAIREAAAKYGEVTEMKITDPRFAP
jgi:predicted Zn-dependent peptidase